MPGQRDTEELLTEFAENPGAETEQLEFKSKEILETTGQKKKVIRTLSAMANQSGGTMIIGVRHQDDGLLFQHFSPDSEWRQELTHVAQQYTSPQLQRLWDISFEECMGHLVLRIDVEKARERLVSTHHNGEYQPWIRDGDGMRLMTEAEIEEFYRRRADRREAIPSSLVERTEFLDFPPHPVRSADQRELLDRRGIVKIDPDYTAVFGFGIYHDYLRKSHTVRLRTSFPRRKGYATIPDVLQAAENHIDAKTDRSFGYSIRVSDLQLVGRSLHSLSEDLKRLDTIYSRLDGANDGTWRYGPVIAGATAVDYGILWFELQQETDEFTRSNLGLILQDIPFDDTNLESFYEEVGTAPGLYDHRHGLQFITLNGSQVEPLRNPEPSPLTEVELAGPLFVKTDNPFYGWPECVESSLESPLPDRFTNGIASIERIPFQVAGGYRPQGNDQFALNYLHFTVAQGIHPTVLIDAVSWQR